MRQHDGHGQTVVTQQRGDSDEAIHRGIADSGSSPILAIQALSHLDARLLTSDLPDQDSNARICFSSSFICTMRRSVLSLTLARRHVAGIIPIDCRIEGASRSKPRTCVTRARVTPSRRAIAAWFGTSPASSWRRHSVAFRSVSTTGGGLGSLGFGGSRLLRRDARTAVTTSLSETARVNAPPPLAAKFGSGPRPISTACWRYEDGGEPSIGGTPSSRAMWTIRKTISGSPDRG